MSHRLVVGAMLVVALASVVVATGGCTDQATARAERDLLVGKALVGGVAFDVRHGLAAIRHQAPGELVLWLGAPSVVIDARVPLQGHTSWRLELRNAMPGATLAATVSSSGTAIDVLAQATERPTRRAYQVELPTDSQVTLTFGPPGAAQAAPFSFAFMSDVQDGVDEVGDLLTRINAEPDVVFLLSAGDLTQVGSAEEMEAFQYAIRWLEVPIFSCIGNHDVPPDTPWHDWFGRGSFRFHYRDVLFSQVDSAGATIAPMVYDWLEEWLDMGRQDVHLLTTHVPPIDPVGTRNGSFASRGEAGKLLAMLARGDVDLTLYGHIHSYYAFENAGIPAYISGGGGAFEEKVDGIGRHFLVIDVDPRHGVTGTRVVEVD